MVYIPFFLGQFISVILIKHLTETRKDRTEDENKLAHYAKKTANMVLSAASSFFYKVEVSLDEEKSYPPKLKFLSEGIYQILSLTTNMILVLLPYVIPDMFPVEVYYPPMYEAVCFVVVPWIIALSLEVNIYDQINNLNLLISYF